MVFHALLLLFEYNYKGNTTSLLESYPTYCDYADCSVPNQAAKCPRKCIAGKYGDEVSFIW